MVKLLAVVVKQAVSIQRALLLLVLMVLVVVPLACTNAAAQSPQIEPRPIGLELVAEGSTAPVRVVAAPDESGRLFVVDQIGQIWVIASNGTLLQEPFLDIADRLVQLRQTYDERGLLGLAFHPAYAQNGRFFVYYSAPLREGAPQDFDHTSRISEFRVLSQNWRTGCPLLRPCRGRSGLPSPAAPPSPVQCDGSSSPVPVRLISVVDLPSSGSSPWAPPSIPMEYATESLPQVAGFNLSLPVRF